MCGRFSFAAPAEVVAEVFGLASLPNWAPRYNIAPSQEVAVIRQEEGERRVALLRWGLVPAWAKEPSVGARLINARAETVAHKPAFRSAFRARRCLVPADGFYEWVSRGGEKTPFYITFTDGRVFAMAGLWERWTGGSQTLETCTILTTTPNEIVAPLHDRMPVILAPEDYRVWLDPAHPGGEELGPLLQPCPPDGMTAWPVSRWVNDPRHDDPSCRAPLTTSR